MPEQEVRKDINPQLCKKLNPEKHKWDHAWIVEPKFDGLRCIIVVEKGNEAKAYSRNGRPLYNMNHILNEVSKIKVLLPSLDYMQGIKHGFILDGEVYTKDWNLSMGIVKSSVTKHSEANKLMYHVWDCLTLDEWKSGGTEIPNDSRKIRLFNLGFKISGPGEIKQSKIRIVNSILVHNNEELNKAYTDFLTAGYEGAILKEPSGHYECGRRSPNWLKIKPWTDADLQVVGCYPGEGKHQGRIGGLVLEGECEWNGRMVTVQTEVGTGFTDEEREFYQNLHDNDTLVGRIVEIKFQDITADGACRFPVYNRLREDKE